MLVVTVTIGVIVNLMVFLAIGWWPVFLFCVPRNRLITTLAIAPTMGFAITSLVATYLILLDYPVKLWSGIYVGISIACSLIVLCYFLLKNRFALNKLGLYKSDLAWLVLGFVIITIMVVSPMILGGINFTIFRGNGGDAVNYMTLAGYLDHQPYSWKNTASLVELMDENRSYPLAIYLLNSRWTTSAMLAYTSRVSNLPIYQFEYSYTLLFFIISFGPSYLIARRLRLNQISAFFAALVVGVGFWAQFVLDTRAFSQINSIPLILSISYFFMKVAALKDIQFFKEPVLLGILGSSLIFSYIEIVPLCILGGFLFLLFLKIKKERLPGIIKPLGIMLVVIGAAGAPLYNVLTNFFLNQINYAAHIPNDWHKYYFPWLYSNPIVGFWGMMPLTCQTCFPYWLGLEKVWELLLIILGGTLFLSVLLAAFWTLTHRNSDIAFGFTVSFVSATAIEFLVLFTTKQLWAAGKALSFGYPFFSLLIVSTGLRANRFSMPRVVYRFLKIVVTLWIALQVFIGLARNYVAATGMEYSNYIINHGNYRQYNYDLSPMTSFLENKPRERIWIIMPDRWFSEYTNLVLGTDHQVKDIFGIYDRKNNFVGYQELENNPKYILTNRSALNYNIGWKNNFSIAAETSDIVLLEVTKPEFILLLITAPNGIENWDGKAGFWMGNEQTILNIVSSDNGQIVLTGDFIPGPSISGQESRRLEILDNGTRNIQLYDVTEQRKEFYFIVQRGNNKVFMDVLDRPTISLLPNGDQRTLLLGVTNINIQFVK